MMPLLADDLAVWGYVEPALGSTDVLALLLGLAVGTILGLTLWWGENRRRDILHRRR